MKFSTTELDKDFTEAEVTPKKKRGRRKRIDIPTQENSSVPTPENSSQQPSEIPPQQSRQEQAPQVVVMISPDSCTAMYEILSRILAVGVSKFKDVPYDIASKAMQFTEEEKKLLGPQTAKILNKYAPQMFMKYADELMLAAILGGSIMGKFRAVDEWKEENTIHVAPRQPVNIKSREEENTKEAPIQ